MLYDALIAPFAEFEFMRRALVGVFALALGGAPVGVFLMLRRMSLTGDAMAHAILPGAALGFLVAGLALFAMTLGGIVAGVTVAVGAGFIARATQLKEDASLAAFYLVSLALGVTIVSLKGSNVDLLHILFGTVLALDNATLYLLSGIATVTLLVLAVSWRPLVLECVDPLFLRSVSRAGARVHFAFLTLMVINLVGGHPALLGHRYHAHDRDRDRCGDPLGDRRASRLVSRGRAGGPCDHSHRRRGLCRFRRARTGRRAAPPPGAGPASGSLRRV